MALGTALAHAPTGGGPFTFAWQGYLIVPETGSYTFAADVDDALEVELDGRAVLRIESPSSSSASSSLTRGLHAIRIRYTDIGGSQKMSLYWAREGGSFSALQPGLLVHDVVPPADTRCGALDMGRADRSLCGSAWLLAAASRARRPADSASRAAHVHDGGVVALATTVFACGIWWGLQVSSAGRQTS